MIPFQIYRQTWAFFRSGIYFAFFSSFIILSSSLRMEMYVIRQNPLWMAVLLYAALPNQHLSRTSLWRAYWLCNLTSFPILFAFEKAASFVSLGHKRTCNALWLLGRLIWLPFSMSLPFLMNLISGLILILVIGLPFKRSKRCRELFSWEAKSRHSLKGNKLVHLHTVLYLMKYLYESSKTWEKTFGNRQIKLQKKSQAILPSSLLTNNALHFQLSLSVC